MSSIFYNPNVPNPPNNPSSDVGDMHTNAAAINTWVAVDHTGFNTGAIPSGQHKQVTLQGENTPAGKPADPSSVIYTAAGTADSARPQLFWENSNSWSGGGPSLTAPFHLSAIRAWGNIIIQSPPIVWNNQAVNVSSVTNAGADLVVNLTSNAVNGDKYTVMILFNGDVVGPPFNGGTRAYFINSSTQFTIQGGFSSAGKILFVVLQI